MDGVVPGGGPGGRLACHWVTGTPPKQWDQGSLQVHRPHPRVDSHLGDEGVPCYRGPGGRAYGDHCSAEAKAKAKEAAAKAAAVKEEMIDDFIARVEREPGRLYVT